MIKLSKNENPHDHHIDSIEYATVKISYIGNIPSYFILELFDAFNDENTMTFKFDIEYNKDERVNYTGKQLFDLIEHLIKFDNKHRNIISYHPEILEGILDSAATKLNDGLNVFNIDEEEYDKFKMCRIFINNNQDLIFEYFDNIGNRIHLNYTAKCVYFGYGFNQYHIDSEMFIKHKLAEVGEDTINKIVSLFGV